MASILARVIAVIGVFFARHGHATLWPRPAALIRPFGITLEQADVALGGARRLRRIRARDRGSAGVRLAARRAPDAGILITVGAALAGMASAASSPPSSTAEHRSTRTGSIASWRCSPPQRCSPSHEVQPILLSAD